MKTKRILYVLFVALIVFACSTTKKTAETSLGVSMDSKETIAKDSVVNSSEIKSDKTVLEEEKEVEKTIEEIGNKTSELSGKLTTYDTSLPKDSITGKPPVKSELEFTNRETSDNKKLQSEKTNENSGKANDLNSAIEKGLKVTTDEKKEEKAQLNQEAETTEKRAKNNFWLKFVLLAGAGVALFFFIKKIPFVSIYYRFKNLFQKK